MMRLISGYKRVEKDTAICEREHCRTVLLIDLI